ncbi:unnamed protein product [Brassicogethes aeneus]|uniref:Protein sleepless n=1 Tax=Brassicogethes aeneus TaxID=1431903 RepID=A0A9P0FFN9_BRAAE|nr:unnamed protein product [Brassicogethes aeneus]
MPSFSLKFLLVIYCFSNVFELVYGIKCYQCSAAKSLDCSDMMVHMDGIQPHECDSVFEAEYCVKSTSLDDGIGSKRFCSSIDLGNYCNYVKQPGDLITYRSCVFTCSSDGCNSSSNHIQNLHFFILLLFCLLF